MKKVLLFVAVVAAFSFASCKKDRVCTCTTTSTAPGSTSTTSVTTITKAKKGDAKKACINSSSVSGTYTITSTCTLN